jgi:predicted DNA-binding protein (MmcQ/YjbR family)
VNPLEKALRAYALHYPEAYEDFPWDERVIKVRGKIFAFLGMVDNKFRLGVKLTHSNEAALGLPSVQPSGYGLGRAGWVTVWVVKTGQPPVELLKTWIDESYRTVAPRKLVAQLKGGPGDLPSKRFVGGESRPRQGSAGSQNPGSRRSRAGATASRGQRP